MDLVSFARNPNMIGKEPGFPLKACAFILRKKKEKKREEKKAMAFYEAIDLLVSSN